MKITINELISSETARKLSIDNTPDKESLKHLEEVADFLNTHIAPQFKPAVWVNSGYRCKKLNDAVGGVETSHHRTGYAADLTCENVPELVRILKSKIEYFDQIIYYKKKNFVHVSIHPRQNHQYLEK